MLLIAWLVGQKWCQGLRAARGPSWNWCAPRAAPRRRTRGRANPRRRRRTRRSRPCAQVHTNIHTQTHTHTPRCSILCIHEYCVCWCVTSHRFGGSRRSVQHAWRRVTPCLTAQGAHHTAAAPAGPLRRAAHPAAARRAAARAARKRQDGARACCGTGRWRDTVCCEWS